MGYESRVIIAQKSKIFKGHVSVLAELQLSGMPDSFLGLFDKQYTGEFYDFYARDDVPVKKDRYDKCLTYATFNKVYKWCLDNKQEQGYRRVDMLLAVLNVVRTGWYDYKDFIIIHYGY